MWKPQIVRKSLVVCLRNKLEEELCEKAEEITKREIEQEINVIKVVKEVSDAWGLAMDGNFKEIPQIVWEHYGQIPRFHQEPDKYILPLKNEPDYMVRKEAVNLSLVSYLYRPIIDPAFQYKGSWGIRTWYFVWLCQKNNYLCTWAKTKEFLDDMKKVIAKEYQQELMKTHAHLKERLNGISNKEETETKTVLLKPLSSILQVDASPQKLKEEIDKVFGDATFIEIPHSANCAKERVEKILEGLPDPKKVPCEEAIKRIIEIYESIPEKDGFINIKTVEDATILDHMKVCDNDECNKLAYCVEIDWWYRVCKNGWCGSFERHEHKAKKIIDSAKKSLGKKQSVVSTT